MAASLPSLSPAKVARALERAGFQKLRQRGSHLILYNPTTKQRVVVPMHKGKDIKKPLLAKILSQEASLTVEEFLELL